MKVPYENMDGHVMSTSCPKYTLIYGTLVGYIVTIILNGVLNTPGISPFNNTIGNLSDKYFLPIVPTNGTFGIWAFIYIWQLVLVVYLMTLLCRKCNGKPLYLYPGIASSTFLIFYILNFVANNVWIVVWLEEKVIVAAVMLLLATITLAVSLVRSCSDLDKSGAFLEQNGFSGDIWCMRIIVQNGIAFYLAWVTVATSINFATSLHYKLGVSVDESCFASLFAVTAILVSWFVLGIVYDRQLRYVCSHYLTYLIAIYGVLERNYDPTKPYEIYVLVLMILVALLALAKLIIVVVRSIKNPIHYIKSSKTFNFQPIDTDVYTVKY